MNTLSRLFLLFVLLFAVSLSAVVAQDAESSDTGDALVTEELPIGEKSPATFDDLVKNLFTVIYNIVYLPFAVPAVLLLTSLSKRIFTVQANILSLFWTVIIWALWVFANELGYGGQFETMLTSLTTVGATLLGISLTPIVAGRLYNASVDNNVALLGYQRTTLTLVPTSTVAK